MDHKQWIDVIGIIGKKQSGKSTLAKGLVQEFMDVYKFSYAKKLSYSTPLKTVVSILFQIPMVKLQGTDETKSELSEISINGEKASYRYLLQYFGTDVIRNHWPDLWIRHMNSRIKTIVDHMPPGTNPPVVVIDDVRFVNEANYIKTYKRGVLIKLARNVTDSDQHTSERSAESLTADYKIDNQNYTPLTTLASAINYLDSLWHFVEGEGPC